MINWQISETQTDLPGCAAYVASSILSNKLQPRTTRAVDILNYCYPKQTVKQREAQSVSPDQLIKYTNSRGTYPIFTEDVVTHNIVENNLRKGNGLYVGGVGYGDSKKTGMLLLYLAG